MAQACSLLLRLPEPARIPAMRLLLVLAALPWLGCGCSPSPVAARATDGTLQLEVGGGHGSLRGSLQAAGIEVGPPRRLRPVAPEPVTEPAESDQAPPQPTPGPHTPPAPVPVEEPKPTPDYFVVTLGPRQNLIQLAKKHLGNGNRFRDIMALNGWSEADTRRLQAGQKVKIPRVAAASSPRR
jgi:nucleoid-associated protein YgaU